MFRKFIITFFSIVLVISIPGYVTSAYVQGYYGESSFPGTQCSVTFQNPVTPHSLLICVIRESGGATATVTSGGRTFTLDKSQFSPVSGWIHTVYSLADAAGGTTTVTANAPGATFLRMSILEYSDIALSSPAHRTASAEGSSGTANSGSVTTTIDDCTLFCTVATDSDGGGFVAGSGFTMREFGIPQPGTPDKTAVEDQVAVDIGTYSGTMSISSDSWAAILVTYKPMTPPSTPSSGGGGGCFLGVDFYQLWK